MPWERTWCHQWEASQAGNTNPHSRPRYDGTFTRSCLYLRIHGCKAREVEKAEMISNSQVIQRTVNQRTLWEALGLLHYGSHNLACFLQVPKSLRNPAHTKCTSRTFLSHLGYLLAADTTETLTWAGSTDPALWSGDSTNHTT